MNQTAKKSEEKTQPYTDVKKIPLVEKKCGKCQETKSVAEFFKCASRPDGLQHWCKKCRYIVRGVINPNSRNADGTLPKENVRQFETPEQIAYAAGFFDGEGHAGWRLNKVGEKHYGIAHVSIAQCSLPVLEWFQTYYGGSIYAYEPKGGSKQAWQWSIVGTRVVLFLEQLQPYLQVKQEQVANVLQQHRDNYAKLHAA